MDVIIATNIIADRPTSNGNIYQRDELERVIREFNRSAKKNPIKGSILDRAHIAKCEFITHETKSLFINESGVLCASITILNDDLKDKVKNGMPIIGRPLISLPGFITNNKPMNVTIINRIHRIQLECCDGPTTINLEHRDGFDGNKIENS